MPQLELYFSDGPEPALAKSIFRHESFEEPLKSIRGNSDALDGYNSFRWTPAVQALAILMIHTAAGSEKTLDQLPHTDSILVGENASPAASLDYAITKQTSWLLDMFGMDYDGNPLIRSFIKRHNSERKRPGPVTISVDSSILPADSIKIYLGDARVKEPQQLHALADQLAANWKTWGTKHRDGHRPVLTSPEELALPLSPYFSPPTIAVASASIPAVDIEILSNPIGDLQPETPGMPVDQEASLGPVHISMSRLVAGFSMTILSAGFWGVGNVVTRWTAWRLPRASFDIALLKYIIASFVLGLIGVVLARKQKSPKPWAYYLKLISTPKFLLSAFAKGLNTYCWILAVTTIAAGNVATLENLHIVWTALAVTLLFSERIPGAWIAGSVTVIIGATMITGVMVEEFTRASITGISFGLISGLAFSVFIVSWSSAKHAETLAERTIEMALLLLASACSTYPLHLLINAVWLNGSLLPLSEVGLYDGCVQTINGLFGIAATYFLLNEANAMMRDTGNLSTLLLAIGMSFAVPITMVAEWLLLNRDIESYQWMGVVLFVIGFTTVRAGILRLKT